MKRANGLVVAVAVSVVLTFNVAVAQHEMPAGMTHEQHMAQMKKQAEMKKRGDGAMGFDQDKTTHHFYLTENGGTIQVESNDAADSASRDQIRSHLRGIAKQFADGDFTAPFKTHNEVLPGVAEMRKLKAAITYSFQEKPTGGAVRITSYDPNAVKAVHAFLQYQIREHATGDPMQVSK